MKFGHPSMQQHMLNGRAKAAASPNTPAHLRPHLSNLSGGTMAKGKVANPVLDRGKIMSGLEPGANVDTPAKRSIDTKDSVSQKMALGASKAPHIDIFGGLRKPMAPMKPVVSVNKRAPKKALHTVHEVGKRKVVIGSHETAKRKTLVNRGTVQPPRKSMGVRAKNTSRHGKTTKAMKGNRGGLFGGY